MSDDLYLDGTQPYHRHGVDVHEGASQECGTRSALPVVVFDAAALVAHDEAVRQAHEHHPAGGSSRPLYDPEQWQWVMIEPLEPGQEPTEGRVLAGWDHEGTFRRYVSTESLVAALRDTLEQLR